MTEAESRVPGAFPQPLEIRFPAGAGSVLILRGPCQQAAGDFEGIDGITTHNTGQALPESHRQWFALDQHRIVLRTTRQPGDKSRFFHEHVFLSLVLGL